VSRVAGATAFAASTIDLDSLAARIADIAQRCDARAASIAGAGSLLSPEWHYGVSAIAAHVSEIAADLRNLGSAVGATAQAYQQREEFLRAAAHEASSTLFWGLGRLLATVAPAVIPAVVGGAVALLAASALTGRRPEDLVMAALSLASTATGTAELSMTEVISAPEFVRGLEFAVSGIDDFVAGLVGMPLPLIATLGERGMGVSSPAGVAESIVRGAGALGAMATLGALVSGKNSPGSVVLAETPVRVTRVSGEEVSAPQGIEALLRRIPRADPEMPQVRIEQYSGGAGEPSSFVVYLGGTIDAGLMATEEPWDMTSNLQALADMDAGSYRAAVDAMTAAGIASDDLVTLVGHSQGGLLAARIAEGQEFRVGDVVTVGAPIHQIQLPATTRLTAIEHTEDLIPALGGVALGGVALAGAGGGGNTTTVRREALGGIRPDPRDPLPGHNLSRYIETGRAIDLSAEPQLTALRNRLVAATSGQGEASLWRGERVTR
jgi:hypothetical protein